MAKKNNIYYIEQRFVNDVNGNPRKAITTYTNDGKEKRNIKFKYKNKNG